MISADCYFEGLVELLVLFLQVSALLLQLVVSPQQPPFLFLSYCSATGKQKPSGHQDELAENRFTIKTNRPLTCFVCDVGLNKVLWPRHVLLVQNLKTRRTSSNQKETRWDRLYVSVSENLVFKHRPLVDKSVFASSYKEQKGCQLLIRWIN